ncbi:hypothetical protein PG984_008212 [Apiospora sp. TS-2023a]
MYAPKLLLFVAAAVSASPLGPLVQPWSNSTTTNNHHHRLAAREAPKFYSGPYTSFPGKATWKDFDTLWAANVPSMKAKGDHQSDVDRIKTALQSVGPKYGIEPRVLLCIMMQESHGDVGAFTTTSKPDNLQTGGLFQCYNCPGFYQQYGLSQSQITSMVEGGAKHFKGDLDHAVNQNNLSDAPNATPAYVSDISQRLGGWVD